jgi:hypothetical protein
MVAMLETMYETIVDFGYTGWIVTVLAVGALWWSALVGDFFVGKPRPDRE